MLRRALDWFLLAKALGEARGRLAAEEERGGAHLQQARLAAEVMNRVAEPAETLPPGNRAASIIALGREAVASILAARPRAPVAEGMPPPPSQPDALADALDQAPPELLLAATPDAATLGVVKEALLARPAIPDTSPTKDEEAKATQVRSFVEALLWNEDAPRRQVDRLLVLRLGRLLPVVAVLALVGLGVYRLSAGTNLAAGKPFVTSSTWSGCSSDPMCDGRLLFHTNNDNQPWFQVDLMKPAKIHRIEVQNRTDCCAERIAPLVIEVSLDGQQWFEVGRKNEQFTTWVLKFPARQARYVKLHVARVSTLHIKDLIVQ